MATKSFVAPPIAGALSAADEILGANRNWRPQTDKQAWFVEQILTPLFAHKNAFGETLESICSWEADDIVAFLRERGFEIEIPEGTGSDFFVGSVLKMLVEWAYEGVETEIASKGVMYPAACLDEGVQFWNHPSHEHPIIEIETKNSVQVYFTIADEPVSEQVMHDTIANLNHTDFASNHRFRGVKFPMVDLEDEPSVDWLLGLRTTAEWGQNAVLVFLKQVSRLKMNHKGAKVESAVAGGVMLESCFIDDRPFYVVDKPFLIWFCIPGVPVPVAAFYVDRNAWKNPGDI